MSEDDFEQYKKSLRDNNPCREIFRGFDKKDYERCMNKFQSHTCQESCFKTNADLEQGKCRKKFPRDQCDDVTVQIEKQGSDQLPNIKCLPKRPVQCQRINQSSRWLVQTLRCNTDFQLVLQEEHVVNYLAKYVLKSELMSEKCKSLIKTTQQSELEGVALLQSIVSQVIGRRDVSNQELTTMLHLGELWFSNLKIEKVYVYENVKIQTKFDQKKRNMPIPEYFFIVEFSCLVKLTKFFKKSKYKSIGKLTRGMSKLQKYKLRNMCSFASKWRDQSVRVPRRKIQDDQTDFSVMKISELVNLSFSEFWHFVSDVNISTKRILKRNMTDNLVVVVKPNIRYKPDDPNHWQYCRNQLIKFKPFCESLANLFTDREKIKTEEDIANQDWIDEYQRFKAANRDTRIPSLYESFNNEDNYALKHSDKNQDLVDSQSEEIFDGVYEDDQLVNQFTDLHTEHVQREGNTDDVQGILIPLSVEQQQLESKNMRSMYTAQELLEMLEYPKKLDKLNRMITEMQRTTTDMRDLTDKLNSDQAEVYNIVKHHCERVSEKQLFMVVQGSAGTGKSFLIQALKFLLGTRVRISGPTGASAFLIDGVTNHALFHLDTRHESHWSKLSNKVLTESREELQDVDYFILDEFSMIGLRTLGQIWLLTLVASQIYKSRTVNCLKKIGACGEPFLLYKAANNSFFSLIYLEIFQFLKNFLNLWGPPEICFRLREIKNDDRLFGGANIILTGDLYQLSPVLDKPVYSTSDTLSPYQEQGRYAFNAFIQSGTICELKTQMRQTNNTKEDVTFNRLLDSVKLGSYITKPEMRLMQERVHPKNAADFETCIKLYSTNKEVQRHNINSLVALNKTIFKISAIDSLVNSHDDEEFQGLARCLYLCAGAKVYVNSNLWIQLGVFNSSVATVVQIIYDEQDKELKMPSAVVLDLEICKIPDEKCFQQAKRIVVTPIVRSCEQSVSLFRKQLPLNLAYSMTIHKSQGKTLQKASINLGTSRFKWAGLAFVPKNRFLKKKKS